MLLFFCFSRGEKSEALENAVMWAGGRICARLLPVYIQEQPGMPHSPVG